MFVNNKVGEIAFSFNVNSNTIIPSTRARQNMFATERIWEAIFASHSKLGPFRNKSMAGTHYWKNKSRRKKEESKTRE